jgi:hypothetical protein
LTSIEKEETANERAKKTVYGIIICDTHTLPVLACCLTSK